jgi:hypothetical protein
MPGSEEQPPLEGRYRVPLLIVNGIAAFLIARFLFDKTAAWIVGGLGLLCLGASMVNRYTLWRREKSGLMQVGTALLGFGLLVAAVAIKG